MATNLIGIEVTGTGTSVDGNGDPIHNAGNGHPVTFRLVDTGLEEPQDVALRFEFGPQYTSCVDGHSPHP